MRRYYGSRGRGSRGGWKIRLIIAGALALFSLISYYSMREENPVTGEGQQVALSTEQEIALGLQARPDMVAQHRGLHGDERDQAVVDRVGGRLLEALNRSLAEQGRENPYPFEFHLLADDQTINAFALPGGQVFITAALYERLETEGQLAGVLGHEIGHVLARHGAQRLAQAQLTQGLANAFEIGAGDRQSGELGRAVAQLVNMKYGRDDELESDRWGVRLTAEAGYDPRSMIGVMKVLEEASGGGPPEFLSTHPKPANRVAYIERLIEEAFPEGVPEGLKK